MCGVEGSTQRNEDTGGITNERGHPGRGGVDKEREVKTKRVRARKGTF